MHPTPMTPFQMTERAMIWTAAIILQEMSEDCIWGILERWKFWLYRRMTKIKKHQSFQLQNL